MASNPKDFDGGTPYGYNKVIGHSGPMKELAHNGTRPNVVAPTAFSHFKPTPHSGTGYKELGHAGSPGIGNPRAMSSDRAEMPMSGPAMPPTNMKSMPDVPKEPVKWHKKGYTMSVPSTEGEGMAIAAKMKAH